MIALSVVDFPARSVRSGRRSPLADAQRQVADCGDAPVANLDPVELERGRFRHRSPPRSRRGRPRRRSRSPRISAGVPAASVRPWSSTWIRSQTPITSAMLWSISSTPARWSSRTERTTSANSGTSASGRPAAGSSISTNAGSVTSARATPSRRSSPWASEPARASARSAGRRRLSSSVGPPPRLAGCSHRPRAQRSRRFPGPKGPAENGCAGRCGSAQSAPASMSAPAGDRRDRASSTVPELGRSKPVSTFTRVDLPAPFGPIRPTTSRGWSLERDLLQRLDACERTRNGGGPKGFFGPPLDPACRRRISQLQLPG